MAEPKIWVLHLSLSLLYSDELISLAVHHRQRDAKLGSVVGQHNDRVSAWDVEGKHVDGDDQVRNEKKDSSGTAAQLGPCPQVIIELDPGHGAPRHRADQGNVEGSQIDHNASQVDLQVRVHNQS